MCRTCWERFGSPSNDSSEIQHSIVLINTIYDTEASGCPLHTWLDDWGIETEWYPWPDHKPPVVTQAAWDAAVELSELMNNMPVEDRASALARASGYVE